MEWAHLYMIVSRASKRLHIIWVLRRGGVITDDLVAIYAALVRSVLEYYCVVWYNALPAYLSSEIERVQMRALRMIYPDLDTRKPYNLLISLDLRTGAINSVWGILIKFPKVGPCQNI